MVFGEVRTVGERGVMDEWLSALEEALRRFVVFSIQYELCMLFTVSETYYNFFFF